MAADGDVEIDAILDRLGELVGGRVFEGAVPDDEVIRVLGDGKILPHIIIDFGAPVRSTRDRNLANTEAGQPHVIPVQAACVAGDARTARKVAKVVIKLLHDWKPSEWADAMELKGGFGSRNAATANTPSRFNRQLYFETVVNQGIDSYA